MGIKGKVCVKGIWDESIPGISFDENGISNFCKLQEHMMLEYPKGPKGNNDWKNLVNQIKEKGKNNKYDCIIGVSGGVDSSYLLHLAKDYGLRPLAVNLDNGFNSEIAVQNIYKLTKQLDFDLETYVIDYEEIKDLLRSYMFASMPWIDAPTDLAIKSVMYKIANQEGVKYILRGNDFRSEGKQPKEWTYIDNKQLKYIKKRFGNGKKVNTYPSLPFYQIAYYGLIKKIKDVRPFYYIDYQKQKAKQLLIEKYDWKDYGGHHHENLFTKFAMAYWLPLKFGIDKRKINLSAQVLSGAISREYALERINKSFASEHELEDLKIYTLKKLGISSNEFEKIWNSPNKNVFDYPSSYNLIFGFISHFSFLIKRIFNFTPMSITASEMISKK